MHLHPKWQWKIVNALKKTFPGVQFIAATHSPVIMASCKEEHLIKIDDEKNIIYEKTPYGLEINDILSICQESGAIAEQVEKLIADFENSITEGDL